MFCPLCPGTRAQTPSWSKFGRRREGDSRLEGVREGYVGGDGMSPSCHTHPCPGPSKREGQKALRESGTKTGERGGHWGEQARGGKGAREEKAEELRRGRGEQREHILNHR